VDVLGLNYHEDLFKDYSAGIDKPIIATECYEYYSGTAVNFEDITTKNPWGYVLENDNVIGQFIWAGIDYLGESTWPAKGWTGSVLDICGFRKPNAWFRKSIWSDEPVVYLAFHDQNIKIQIDFSISGDGEILGACSPDLASGRGFTQPRAVTSGGKALVMIRAGASAGALEFRAYNEKFEPAAIKFKVK